MSKTAQSKKLEWDRFLEELSANEQYPELQRFQVRQTWQHIIEHVPKVMLPTVSHVEQSIIFSWNKHHMSIEIEFRSDNCIEWHFSDHSTQHFAGSSGEEEPSRELDNGCFTLLKLFKKVRLRGRGGGS